MDPKKRSRVGGRVEIVREAVSRRKMRLSDVMSESFSKYLMELDGDFIAPTGARISRIEEATAAEIGPLAAQNAKDRETRGVAPDQRADWLEAEAEIREKEDADAAADASARSEEWQAEMSQAPVKIDPSPAAPPTTAPPPETPTTIPPGADVIDTDTDDVRGELPSGDDASGFDNPSSAEGGEGVVPTNDETSEDADAQNADPIDDAQGGAVPTDDPSKDLGGPDEFDEKNRAFTSYIDGLINGPPPATGGRDSLPEVSDLSLLRSRSLIEAVYGSRKLEIVNYKRSR